MPAILIVVLSRVLALNEGGYYDGWVHVEVYDHRHPANLLLHVSHVEALAADDSVVFSRGGQIAAAPFSDTAVATPAARSHSGVRLRACDSDPAAGSHPVPGVGG